MRSVLEALYNAGQWCADVVSCLQLSVNLCNWEKTFWRWLEP